MYLKKIELHGFKSFAHKTTLHFDDGVTCVVGPNGCGKSNIVDAVRWAVGEQRARALRSEKMENVIFNGTSTRKALGMAEVLLTVENTRGVLPVEFTEVTLGRRLYRSGESEYLLNGVECRLRDIQDLFMDTGMGAGAYSVIELAMVEEILSDNADDRRRLFEEAAGITRYKLRRRQALGRLGATQHDLTRLRDLTDEIGGAVRSLKRQADKATRFREYDTRRTDLERTLLHAEHDRLTREQNTLKQAHQALTDAAEAEAATVATREADLERLSADRVTQEETRKTRQEALHAHLNTLRTLEAEQRLVRERLARLDAERARLYDELGEGEARRKAQAHIRARFEDERLRAAPRHSEAKRVLEDAAAVRHTTLAALHGVREGVQRARAQESTSEKTLSDAHRTLDRLQARTELNMSERERLRAEAADVETEPADGLQQAEQARAEAAAAVQQADAAFADAEAERASLEAQRRTLADERRALETRRGALDAEKQVLETLVASYEGFSEAVRVLATERPGLLTVADVLHAGEGWAAALAVALGAWTEALVVPTRAEAEAALDVLRAHAAGQALLLVLDELPRLGPPEGPDALAAHVTATDASYEPVRDLLLHTWTTAPTLEAARAAAAHRPGRVVTPGGSWTDGHGRLRGGSATESNRAPSRVQQRARIDHLGRALDEVRHSLGAVARRDDALKVRFGALDFAGLRQAQAAATQALRDAERTLARTQATRDAALRQAEARTRRLASLDADLGTLAGDAERLTAAAQQAEQALAEKRAARERAERDATAREDESRGVFEQYNEAALAEQQARTRVETLDADLQRTVATLAEMDTRQQARQARYGAVGEEREAADAEAQRIQHTLDARAAEREPFEKGVEEAEDALLTVQATLSEHERTLREARSRRDARIREAHEQAVRLAEVETRLHTLAEDYADTFDAPLEDDAVVVPDEFNAAEARAEVQALRRKIAALGSVNALALEQYDEEKTRLDFLVAQQQDLERAETSLLDTIDTINTEAARRFRETYAQIEASFADLFRELFGPEAKATLTLVDPSDPLESAIEIFARPGGKRPSAITQLSGGEKTLTAIALLFSIYLVKPSPFCILDEVDAPLDEANVDRFMRLIRRFSDRTQFILVTHNKRTMELSDRLYGVTMQEPGVSKTVTVRFEDADVAGAEKAA